MYKELCKKKGTTLILSISYRKSIIESRNGILVVIKKEGNQMEKIIKDSSENQVAELKDSVAKDGYELSYVNELHSELESLCKEKVSLYLRDPSEKQIAELKDIVAKDGHKLSNVCEFIDKDESNSGLKSLCKKVKEGGVDIVYIYSLDDLPKNHRNSMAWLKEFRHAGVEVKYNQHLSPVMRLTYHLKLSIQDYLDEMIDSEI